MKKARKIISYIIMIIAIIVCVIIYKKYNFNDFEKSIRLSNITEFTRDRFRQSNAYRPHFTNRKQ